MKRFEVMEKVIFVSILLFLAIGCGGKGVVRDPVIANPFAGNAELAEKKNAGVVFRRSIGPNSVEISLPESGEDAEFRYDLSELREGLLPDIGSTDHITYKKKADDKETMGPSLPMAEPQSRYEAGYLLGIAKIKELYRKREFELALVQVEGLLQTYPNDARLLAMRGTLAKKLSYDDLAEESWSRALAKDPGNEVIRTALSQLKKKQSGVR